MNVALYFSDHFRVDPALLDQYGAFNISLVADLPLFIDPFLLFNSKKLEYRALHDAIIEYLKFLRDKSANRDLDPGLIRAWYRFPEVKQIWLGFTTTGNRGSGLGADFADALHSNLNKLFSNFGNEQITKGSHLEKLCLIRDRVGRDNISDFTSNLIRAYLANYTQTFAQKYIAEKLRKRALVEKARFNYRTEVWEAVRYDLPYCRGDYVLLTPRDMLTKDNTWINRADLVDELENVPDAIPNEQLRAQVNNYLLKVLPQDDERVTVKEKRKAALKTLTRFPVLIDYFIKYKENDGRRATTVSSRKVELSRQLYVEQFQQLARALASDTEFYTVSGNTRDEALKRVMFLKDEIESRGGYKIFYIKGKPIQREDDLQILYKLTWYGTLSDISREVNDGRGPVDFKASRGAKDKTLVEMKLARNSKLKQNLQKQLEVYKKASAAQHGLKVIIYFTREELVRVQTVLRELKMEKDRNVILIDARKDNKPSGSRA
jgi:hypothetical protein